MHKSVISINIPILSALFLLTFWCGSVAAMPLHFSPDGSIILNNISFQLQPIVQIQSAPDTYFSPQFSCLYTQTGDSSRIAFISSEMSINLSLIPNPDFTISSSQLLIEATYHTNFLLHDLGLKLMFADGQAMQIYKGEAAISSRDASHNIDLVNYRDKVAEYRCGDQSFFLVASNFNGAEGIERLTEDALLCYDHRMHYTRLYNPRSMSFDQPIDYKPVWADSSESWSALLFADKPPLLMINRWLGDKKAALALTNDADCEDENRLRMIFYGNSNPQHPDYGNKGLIHNRIPISNTIYGMHYPLLDNIWQEIRDNGSTIGMHTYTGYADSTHYYEQSLLHDLVGYHIRLWIDHSWQLNPENFCKEGGDPASPYYLLDVINRSEIDYVWSGEKPAHNVFDAFTEPFRLPHRQYYFSGLTRPVWFFGRTRMETWQYHNQNHWIDMQYNLTTQNLDNLIRNRGLCIGYTHFSFWFFANTTPFFYFDEQQNYCLRDSVEALFQTLDEYQTQRGLWIAPVETIFDRMLAIEQVRINRIEPIPGRASYRIFLCNNSEMDLIDLFVTCQGTGYHINHLHPGEEHILEVATQSVPLEDNSPATYLISYSNRQILISDKSGARLSPFLCEIYNIKGQKVLSQRNPSPQQSVQIDFTGKSAGIYLVKITAQGTKPVLRKLILTK